MRKVLLALAAATIMAGAAVAGEPLTDQQMDKVAAGFTAYTVLPPPGTPPLTTTVVNLSFFPSTPTRFPTGLGSLQVVGISGLLMQLF